MPKPEGRSHGDLRGGRAPAGHHRRVHGAYAASQRDGGNVGIDPAADPEHHGSLRAEVLSSAVGRLGMNQAAQD
jgi:hypothetical protein